MGGWPPVLGTRDSRDKKRRQDGRHGSRVFRARNFPENKPPPQLHHRRAASFLGGRARGLCCVSARPGCQPERQKPPRQGPQWDVGAAGPFGSRTRPLAGGLGGERGGGGVGTSAFMKIQGPGRSKEAFSAAASFLCGRVYGFF